MGSIIKFIPDPVIVGFTAGIGVIIFVGQWEYFLGLPPITGEHFHIKLWHLVQTFPQFHLATTLLSVLALLLVVYSPKVPALKRVPGPLTALVVITSIQIIFQFDGIRTIGTAFGGIPQGLPEFALPSVSWGKIIELIGPAFTIAMLGAIESLLSAVVADGMTGTRHDSNQELVGQGLANIVTPMLGGFAATGAIARTATNIRNGANGPIAGIMHSITLIVILLVLAPFAVHIPLAVLAAILFVVAWNMSEARHFVKMIRRAPGADVAILLITFSLTVFADLVVAVNIGVILATLHFLRRMATSVEVRQATEQELAQEFAHKGIVKLPPGVLVFAVEGPFFFGAVENFERALAGTHTDPKHLVIRLRWVPFIDITGLQTLEEVIRDFQKRGVNVMLTGANERVTAKLHKAGIIDVIGKTNNFRTMDEALVALQERSPESVEVLPAELPAVSDPAEPTHTALDSSRAYSPKSAEQSNKDE
jgi:SulP family sulfate permease